MKLLDLNLILDIPCEKCRDPPLSAWRYTKSPRSVYQFHLLRLSIGKKNLQHTIKL